MFILYLYIFNSVSFVKIKKLYTNKELELHKVHLFYVLPHLLKVMREERYAIFHTKTFALPISKRHTRNGSEIT